jgi:predicted 3-demethylubiquinone-9 3-methyltransferase (glyoxalase superfamily)
MSGLAICLWFDNRAEEAANFYVSAFRRCGREAAIGDTARFTEAGPGPAGGVLSVSFALSGQEFIALNGGPHFTFSPAISLFVKCIDQDEVDRFWAALSEGGEPGRCGWLTRSCRGRFPANPRLSWHLGPTAPPDVGM